jgi:preprotein translocase subunit SecD
MKLVMTAFFLLASLHTFACSKHTIEFKIDKKSLFSTDDFVIETLKKDNGKWTMQVKFTSKISKKISEMTSKNIGKKLEMTFDKVTMSEAIVKDQLKLKDNEVTLATNFSDKLAADLQGECQHGN